MAGAGKKTFTAGETLTASDVNTYLMEQSVMVFGGTAARSSAIPTPSEGMTSYRTDTQQIESYDGAEWRGMSGLQLVKKQTIGSAVTSVTVTSAFSATYQNYRIAVVGTNASVDNNYVNLTLNGSAGSTYNFGGFYVTFGGTGVNSISGASSTAMPVGATGSQSNTNLTFDIFNPFNANQTSIYSQFNSQGSSWMNNGLDKNAVSHTNFTLFSAASMTGGTIYVYGYGA